MSQLALLRAASTLREVAALLRFRPKALAYILYKKPPLAKYTSFDVPKRGGGLRRISAPTADLQLLQRRLSDLLQICMQETNHGRKPKDQLAQGFKRDCSIVTNAERHQGRRYVFNIDLQDFFPTINFGRVRGFFIKDAKFLLNTKVATILAQIACHENALPQGAPCSPVISNLIGHILDIRLWKLASASGCWYSRYADDITFSTNKHDFPVSIARRVAGETHKWEVGDELQEAVVSAGFVINPAKTRMQYRGSRQAVTGLVVNRKVNIRTEYRRTVRAMAHRLFQTGGFQRLQMVPNAQGACSPTMVDGTMNQLQGMFGYIDAIDRHNFKCESAIESQKHQAKCALSSKQNQYRRFLMFKNFYTASVPVVVCEGKTDPIYILHAIRSLAANYPALATVLANNKVKLNIRILQTAQGNTGRVLRLEGGVDRLAQFIKAYCDEIKRFKAPGMDCAVVLVVDNDSGRDSVWKAIKSAAKNTMSKTDKYVHIAGNLYMVLTPLKGGAAGSEIEDCFGPGIKTLNLDGKTFDANAKADSAQHFGKTILSLYVRDNAAKIDFAGFADLLDRITAAVEAHQTQHATVATRDAN